MADTVDRIVTAIEADYNGQKAVEVEASIASAKLTVAADQACTPTEAKNALALIAGRKRATERAALAEAVAAAVAKLCVAPEVEIGGPQGRDVIVIYPNGKPDTRSIAGEVAGG